MTAPVVLPFDGKRSAVEGGVGEVDVVLLGHAVLGQAQAFAEVSNLSKGHSALEPQGIPAFFIG